MRWSHPHRRRAALLGLYVLISGAGPSLAFDILPDPKLHRMDSSRQIMVGKGKAGIGWSVWDIDPSHYGGEGKLVWMFSQKTDPVPKGRIAAAAWYRRQLQAIVKALGGAQPDQVLVSVEFAGSTVEVEGPTFEADFNLMYVKKEQIVGNIYSKKVAQRHGRLIVFLISDGPRSVTRASADFARRWYGIVKDMSPNESP